MWCLCVCTCVGGFYNTYCKKKAGAAVRVSFYIYQDLVARLQVVTLASYCVWLSVACFNQCSGSSKHTHTHTFHGHGSFLMVWTGGARDSVFVYSVVVVLLCSVRFSSLTSNQHMHAYDFVSSICVYVLECCVIEREYNAIHFHIILYNNSIFAQEKAPHMISLYRKKRIKAILVTYRWGLNVLFPFQTRIR